MTAYTEDDFEHAHFAMHPVTGSVASKGRMDWKWVLPGWYNTGNVSRLSDQQMVDAGWVPVRMPAESRPLTPDAITDEMVKRALGANGQPETSVDSPSGRRMRHILTAALTEPPKRPEGAEDIERLIRDAENEGQGADNEALANYLAARLTDPTRKEG